MSSFCKFRSYRLWKLLQREVFFMGKISRAMQQPREAWKKNEIKNQRGGLRLRAFAAAQLQ